MHDQPKRVTVQDIFDYHIELDRQAARSKHSIAEDWRIWTEMQKEFYRTLEDVTKTATEKQIARNQIAAEKAFAWSNLAYQLEQHERYQRRSDWLFGRDQRLHSGSIGGSINNSLGSLRGFLGGIFK